MFANVVGPPIFASVAGPPVHMHTVHNGCAQCARSTFAHATLICTFLTNRVGNLALISHIHGQTCMNTAQAYGKHTVTQQSLVHELSFSHLGVKELLKHVGTLVVISVGLVERSAVCEQSRHVGNEQVLVNVIVALQTVAYRLQICQNIKTKVLSIINVYKNITRQKLVMQIK